MTNSYSLYWVFIFLHLTNQKSEIINIEEHKGDIYIHNVYSIKIAFYHLNSKKIMDRLQEVGFKPEPDEKLKMDLNQPIKKLNSKISSIGAGTAVITILLDHFRLISEDIRLLIILFMALICVSLFLSIKFKTVRCKIFGDTYSLEFFKTFISWFVFLSLFYLAVIILTLYDFHLYH